MKKTILQIQWLTKYTKIIIWPLLLSLLITAVLSGIGVCSALISKSLIDAATTSQLHEVFKWLGIIGSVFIIRIMLSSLNSIIGTYCDTTLINAIQKQIYKHITYSEWLEQNKYHSMNLLTKINADSEVVTSLITSSTVSLVSLSITFISSFITLFFLDRTVAITAIIISPIFLLLSMFFGKKVKKIYLEVQEHNICYNTFIQESIQNLMIVKTFCKEKDNLKTLDTLQAKTLKLNIRSNLLGLSAGLLLTISSYLTYFIVFAVGSVKLANGMMTFGTLTALLQLFNNIQKPLSGFASVLPSIIRALASVDRLMEIENIPLENRNTPLLTLTPDIKPTITLNHINFSYKPNLPILREISFTINPGVIIGLIGTSGCGKTTLIRLLLNLAHPQSGNLTISSNDLEENLLATHREFISYVPQGNTLFSGTIKENLCYGNPNASPSQLIDATLAACAWDFIQTLDQGFNTPLGERGIGLSEGQAQRLTIARAFLRERPILILDEATSALDPETELKVLHSIKHLKHHPTCVIITHRPSALSICDRVLEIKNHELHTVKLTQSFSQLASLYNRDCCEILPLKSSPF